jgi:hypothetical protein
MRLEAGSGVRRGVIGGVCGVAALVIAVAGCAGPGTAASPSVSARPSQRAASAIAVQCSSRGPVLTVKPGTARPGQDVTVDAPGPWPGSIPRREIETSSFGTLAKASGRQLDALYYLGVIGGMPGGSVGRDDLPAKAGVILAGTGIGDRPFRVEIPAVPSGSYVVQFVYSIIATPGKRPSYQLCAGLRVRR